MPRPEVGNDDQCDTDSLRNQLKKNVSSLFLKMQAILHVSNTATQEIVEHFNQIFSLSEPLIKDAVSDILQRNGHSIAEPTLSEVVATVMDCNVISTITSKRCWVEFNQAQKNLYWVQLPLCNASGVSAGSTWTYQHVCSYPFNDSRVV